MWTLIGVFSAALFGMLTLMSSMFVRIIRTEIGSVRTEIVALRTELKADIQMLDRDVQAIARRVFGDDAA